MVSQRIINASRLQSGLNYCFFCIVSISVVPPPKQKAVGQVKGLVLGVNMLGRAVALKV